MFEAKHFFQSQASFGFKEHSYGCTVSFADRTFQETSNGLQGYHANSYPISSAPCELAPVVHNLLSASLQKSSVPTYRRAWKLYEEFHISVFETSHTSLPVLPATLALLVAYLFNRRYASSTVNTYVSAIEYFHRLAGLRDPTKTFYISEMLKGYGKVGYKLDSRLPITLPILVRIMEVSECFCVTQYEFLMFKAMCAMAFFAFLRIGEITVSRRDSVSGNLLQLDQVSRQHSGKGNVVSLIITFTRYKHNYNQIPFSIVLTRQPKACPVQSFLDYVTVRGTEDGPLFINQDGSPVLRSEFSRTLSSVIQLCNLDPNRYKGHSFRIGAATYAAEQGLPDTKIRQLGRWKSDAFEKYIRITSLESVS